MTPARVSRKPIAPGSDSHENPGEAELLLSHLRALLAAGLSALGLAWQAALVAGLALAMSSTAIAVQTMTERNELATPTGRTAFAILLFQDIAVIPMLAVFPLLRTLPMAPAADAAAGATTWVHGLPAWAHTLAVAAQYGIELLPRLEAQTVGEAQLVACVHWQHLGLLVVQILLDERRKKKEAEQQPPPAAEGGS